MQNIANAFVLLSVTRNGTSHLTALAHETTPVYMECAHVLQACVFLVLCVPILITKLCLYPLPWDSQGW